MPGAVGKGEGELLINWYRVSVGEDEKVWSWVVVMAAHDDNALNATERYTYR